MSACEKCWADAYLRYRLLGTKTQADHYHDLLEERKDNPCTPEQQRGDSPVVHDQHEEFFKDTRRSEDY